MRASLSIGVAVVVCASTTLFPQSAEASCGSPPAMPALKFNRPKVIDRVRAGGEPDVLALHDGTLILASHPGTTHMYKSNLPDANVVTPYDDSEYVWRSNDAGDTWRYVGANGGNTGAHGGPGFSDPTLAQDLGGNVYIAGTDYPTNIYVARSGDSGKHWTSNPAAGFLTDREWLAADRSNTVYLLASDPSGARVILTSHDGGTTFDWGFGMPVNGVDSPITVDQRNGRLYFPGTQVASQGPSPVAVQVFPNLRRGDTSSFKSWVFEGLPHEHGFSNSSAVDAAGNVYIASNTDGEVRLATSTDRGRTWTTQVVYDSSGPGLLWPWVSAGADGKVAVVWLESDRLSPGRQVAGNFRVYAAESVTAHGWVDACGSSHRPVWKTSIATSKPMHSGQICEFGLTCNAGIGSSSDRRLGDYITSSITPDGRLVIAYADTAAQPRAAISHPAFVRETGGANFR